MRPRLREITESVCGDGGELVRIIRAKFPDALLVGTSTNYCRADVAPMEIGIHHFLQEPWCEADLWRILDP